MKNSRDFINGFLSRDGSYVFSATVISRLFSFASSWVALQLISNKELGVIIFSFSIISLIIPFGGLGLYQSLIRYGALLNLKVEKDSLFIYVFKKGLIVTSFITVTIITCALFIPFKYENTSYYLIFFSLVLVPHYLLSIIKIQFRLKHDNKTFSFVEIVYSVFLLITVLIFSYLFSAKGYALSLLITPIITVLIFLRKLNINFHHKKKLSITDFSFWKYGFFASLAVSVSQFLLAIDVVLIGYLIHNSENITQYKYISLIPFSLLFLSQVFINTDFVTFTEQIKNKKFIFNYMKRYMIFFCFISVIICSICFLFSNQILILLDPSFIKLSIPFLILTVGICGILIFRGLYGNLLSSIGKVHINYYIGGAALIINVISNYYLIPKFGITGAAITTAVLMWFTGIISYVWFLFLYKKY